jgi:hypothetical protein
MPQTLQDDNGQPAKKKLKTRSVTAHQRTLETKVADLNPVEYIILHDYIRHIQSQGQEGHNPARAGATEHRTHLGLSKAGGWSSSKFRGRAKKVALIAFQARDEFRLGKLFSVITSDDDFTSLFLTSHFRSVGRRDPKDL